MLQIALIVAQIQGSSLGLFINYTFNILEDFGEEHLELLCEYSPT
jgi:hypothetical protein